MKIFTEIMIAIFIIFLFPACTDVPTGAGYITRPITEDYSGIADPHTRWNAYNIKNYVIEQQISCFCPDALEIYRIFVRNNEIIDVIKKSDGKSVLNQLPHQFKTVDDLFALAGSINPDSVALIEVQYDQRFGFPKYIYVDSSSEIADEELSYTSGGIERLLN